MITRIYLTRAAFAVAIGLGACAPMTRSTQVEDRPTDRSTMVVENNNWSDMTVYILRDGIRTRLGSVPSMGRSSFKLTSALVGGTGELRVLADPMGSAQKWMSQPLLIVPGSQVIFRLENNVQLSTYSMR